MRRLAWVIVIVFVLLVVALSFVVRKHSRVPTTHVLFRGVVASATNTWGTIDATNSPYAMILFTNSVAHIVNYRPAAVHYLRGEQWITNTFTTNWDDPEYFMPSNWVEHKLRGEDNVIGSQATLYFVPMPGSNITWRVAFECQEQTAEDKRKHLWGRLVGEHSWSYSGRKFELVSPSVQ